MNLKIIILSKRSQIYVYDFIHTKFWKMQATLKWGKASHWFCGGDGQTGRAVLRVQKETFEDDGYASVVVAFRGVCICKTLSTCAREVFAIYFTSTVSQLSF